MSWSRVDAPWTSRLADRPLSQAAPPLTFHTPALAWDYGALSEPLPAGAGEAVLHVRARSRHGRIGLALMKPNGSALLSQEAQLTPEVGEADLYFRLFESYGPARLVVRSFGEPEGLGAGDILVVETGRLADVPPGATILGADAGSEGFDQPVRHASNIAQAHEPMWPISLGNTCEAKVQIARVLQFRRWPESSQAAFRLRMLPPDRSKDVFGWDLFDWQGAPFNALLAYLRQDFQGLFERGDLQPHAAGVLHRRLGCEHFHDFEHLKKRSDLAFTEAMVDAGYPEARARFDRLAAAFRALLSTSGPYLYVHACEDIPSELRVRQLIEALGARSPHHRFHLLFVGFEDEDSDLSALSDQVSKAYRPHPPTGAGANWEGDYEAWDKALAPFDLLLPSESPAANAEPSRRPGLISRLFARTGSRP